MPEEGRRRSERLFLTFPIRVEGSDSQGRQFSETTRTIVVNRHGARILLKHSVTAGQAFKVISLVNGREATFRVVGLTSPVSDRGAEWGVEYTDERQNLWGIDFPPIDEKAAVCSVVLECRRCRAVALTKVSIVEYDVLEAAGAMPRDCKSCGQTTNWGYAQNPVRMPAPGEVANPEIQSAIEPPAPSKERRISPRVSLRLPIRVRSWQGIEEFTKSENVSKSGIAFATDKLFEVGETLQVTCPYNPAGQNIELRARVIRRSEMASGGRYLYGVRYEM